MQAPGLADEHTRGEQSIQGHVQGAGGHSYAKLSMKIDSMGYRLTAALVVLYCL